MQVRTCYRAKRGSPIISLVSTAGGLPFRRLAEGSFTILVGYDIPTDTAFVFTADEVAHLKKAVTVSPEAVEAFHKFPFT